ncbi:MAG TPA: trypsin-like serine protease [Solirubrobacteraceae bacterium]|jgi:secreted trypsin-like serine protease|nr:trypsin-like serine protease [Solirubrobacteraceae bacterium]
MSNSIVALILAGLAALLLSCVLVLAPVVGAAIDRHGVPRRAASAHAAVIGGSPAPAGTFASVAEVLDFRGKIVGQCTGTVVAPHLVLTAGHCAEDVETGIMDKAAGYRVLTGGVQEAGERQISTVTGVIVDEDFHRRVDDGDAALLVLATATTAPPIRLATAAERRRVHAGMRATVAGWGKTRYEQQAPTPQLYWADTVVQAGRWCALNAPPFYARNEICAIDPPNYQTGACNGDSGGPLLVHEGPQQEVIEIGVVVHGYGHCSTRRPSVFTRVEAIAGWVKTWVDAYASPAPPAS